MAQQPQPDDNISTGEKIFDWSVYGGLAGLGTFLATIPIAYWMKYEGGKPHYDNAAKWMAEHSMKGKVSNAVLAATITMQGGNLMMVPVTWAEHFKVPLVQNLNKMTGDKVDPNSIEAAPKKTWYGLAGSRALAWMMVFSGFFSMGTVFENTFNTFEAEFSDIMCKLLKKPTHIDPVIAEMKLGEKMQYVEKETKSFRLGKIAALDVFATIAASSLLYMVSRVFAEKSQDNYPHRHLPPLFTPKKQRPSMESTIEAKAELPRTQVSETMREQTIDSPSAVALQHI